jgi:hypothetical protein
MTGCWSGSQQWRKIDQCSILLLKACDHQQNDSKKIQLGNIAAKIDFLIFLFQLFLPKILLQIEFQRNKGI